MDFYKENRAKETVLLQRLKEKETELRQLKQDVEAWHAAPDSVYRFYHQSYKVFHLNDYTKRIIRFFAELMEVDANDLHPYFQAICEEALSKEFTPQTNKNWFGETRPVLEAYYHAKHLLDMMVLYGLDASEKEREGTGGWFSVLYLYGIR